MTEGLPRLVHVASGREWRGGQRQVLLLTRELERLGAEQVVVTRDRGRLAAELRRAGVRVAEVPWEQALSVRALGAVWREARRRPAILHAHDSHALTISALAATLARRPWVATRRTAFPLRRPLLWRRARQVVAVSGAVRRVLVDGGVPGHQISVVPSAIDLRETRATSPAGVRQAHRLPPDAPLAVNVAALTREKDHDTLLRAATLAAEQVPDLHWAIAGDGPLRLHLERTARELGISDRIHFLGWLDDPLPLIAAAQLFVLTSTAEGVGTVLLDAMALGVPIVASAVGGVPETVADAGLLIPPSRPDAVAAAVAEVLENQSLADRLAALARARVESRDAPGMAHAMLAIYRSAARPHRGPDADQDRGAR